MGRFEVGFVLVTRHWGPERQLPRWADVREMALRAEALGFDTVWLEDELLWRPSDGTPLGFWDGVSMAGAVAAVTSRIKVGSWVLSALHRNPGIIAKTAETLDEISGGRFVFGLGAGHTAPGQAHSFGLPEDRTSSRFAEAVEVIVPLMREGRADFDGTFHAAHDLPQLPQGPRPNRIPLMLAAQGPNGMRLAAQHADIWSCFAENRSDMVEFGPRIPAIEAACTEVGRDPMTIGRSAGVDLHPLEPEPDPNGAWIGGSPEQMADQLRAMRDGGYTQVALFPTPSTIAAMEAVAPVLGLLRTDEAWVLVT
jgi:alkanesulfonate monooxygenase SsuD/methylene tetrahydromethanopterin reductase-like flavin-dependent oxidoreductase (luciferase family)